MWKRINEENLKVTFFLFFKRYSNIARQKDTLIDDSTNAY